MCTHHTDPGIHVAGVMAGDPGISLWDVGCDLEDLDKVDKTILLKRSGIKKMMEHRFGKDH